MVDMPPKNDLRGSFAILCGELKDRRMVQWILCRVSGTADAAANRCPGLRRDAQPSIELAQFPLVERRMQFDLIHGRGDFRALHQFLQVLRAEIANSDCTHSSVSQQFLCRAIGFCRRVEGAWDWPVQ